MNADYVRIHPGYKVVRCTGQTLTKYFDEIVREEEDKEDEDKNHNVNQ
jgi:hypothetical protein